jgi:precorrin-6Y C5,15-methyltransferase (decarboxylating)
MTNIIELIGISGQKPWGQGLEALRSCSRAVASGRYAHIARSNGLDVIPIAPVKEMLQKLETALLSGPVAVLASGDPLFFGVGRTLIKKFGAHRINIHPALSSMQLACARFRIPWNDMKFISLHGREHENTAPAILRHEKTVLFTDSRNSPDTIARSVLDKLTEASDTETISSISVHVAENLGLPDEKLVTGSLEEIASQTFRPMNIMIVVYGHKWYQRRFPESQSIFGLNETEIYHSRGLITKDEVRAVTLHRLRLPATGCFWDVGAGSGSVSIEASRLCPELCVFAIEKKPDEQKNIIKNIGKFGCWNINLIKGEAPGSLASLPCPHRIFIGGSGGRLDEIIETCCERLAPAGRIVLNAVLPETARRAPVIMRESGLDVSEVRVSFERNPGQETNKKFNPITIITGIK